MPSVATRRDQLATTGKIVEAIFANPRRRVDVELGDTKQPQFIPQSKLLLWGNECNFSARLVDDDPAEALVAVDDAGRLEWKKGQRTARFYPLDPNPQIVDGGFEIEVEYASRPASNVLTYSLQHKNLDFFYQPELTPEEVAEGSFRPPHIVGSYAVYHKTKANNIEGGKQYDHGLAFRILCPTAKDSAGLTTRSVLHIDEATGLLTVTTPWEFFDNAIYPAKVDPTIGYYNGGTPGGTTFNFQSPTTTAVANMVSTLTASSGDTITKYSVYGSSGGSPTLGMTAYTVVSGSPSARLAAETLTAAFTSTPAWVDTAAVSQALSAGTAYCVALRAHTTTTTHYYDAGSAPGRINSTSTTLDDPFSPTGTDSGRHYSWYATYTAGAAGITGPLVGFNHLGGGGPLIGGRLNT